MSSWGDPAVGLRREQEAGEWRTTVSMGSALTLGSEFKGLHSESSRVNLCLTESETESQESGQQDTAKEMEWAK